MIGRTGAASHRNAAGVLAGPGQQLWQWHDPRLTRNLPPVMKKRQCWYASDGEALREVRHCITVHLDQPQLRLELGGRLLEDRSHHPTRATPGRPEINEERNVAARRMPVKASSIAQRKRPTFEQWSMAGSALWAGTQSRARDAIDRVALGTNDVQRVVHSSPLPDPRSMMMARAGGCLD
jgi:hypothetical protein